MHSETKLLNFLLYVVKHTPNYRVHRLLWEYSIENPRAHPDILCFFTSPVEFYSLLELKKRNSSNNQDIESRIRPQYESYRVLAANLEDLDAETTSVIPLRDKAPFFLNYLFHDSSQDCIDFIVRETPLDSDVFVFHICLDPPSFSGVQLPSQQPNRGLIQAIQAKTRLPVAWRRRYVPFTLNDIIEIRGQGGSRVKVPKLTGLIVIQEIFGFILQRKIRGIAGTFQIEDLFNFIFAESILYFDSHREKAIKTRIRLFLKHLIEVIFTKLELNVLTKHPSGGYQIILRKTETFTERLREIQKEARKYLKQTQLDEFF